MAKHTIAELQQRQAIMSQERCYECRGYGDDYYLDENGDLVNACAECPFNGEEGEDDK